MYGIHSQGDGFLGCFCLIAVILISWALFMRFVAPTVRVAWRRLQERPGAAIGAGVICVAAGLGGAVWLVEHGWDRTAVLSIAVMCGGLFAVSGGLLGWMQSRVKEA